ncbi:glycosyltransferase involved in cell wall biosynthesis [Fluviicoccus keumensis]|uniref:Glycosyltransferase involved in cell wall biosynthesis n=1 Tax=Fluviicoccus keumensis TaxID=1435465 RepID=A0A4Q7ZAC4_9GAMM|nr:glycosyltransferase [Fluviicoccus keumensis]RZU46845.1 glycosyltransferase involved in cell wall biosynthesis [Fluviicoccus keumensis]
MKILHVTEDFSPENAGMTTAVLQMTKLGAGLPGASFVVVAVGSRAVPVSDEVRVRLCPNSSGVLGGWRYSPDLEDVLREEIPNNDVVHIHGLWMYPQWKALRLAAEYEKPVIITPHNMLGGWVWEQGGFLKKLKKSLYWSLVVSPALGRHGLVHVLSEIEAKNARPFFGSMPFYVAPNGVDVNGVVSAHSALGDTQDLPERFLAFLGRLHPVKGVELIVEAMGLLSVHERIPVLLIGPEESEQYVLQLKSLVKELGLEDFIRFIGPVFGNRKYEILGKAIALVAPSHSEGISMAALEAMSCSTPVITTLASGIDDIEKGGGVLVDTNPASLAKVLAQIVSWTESDILERRSRALEFVRRGFDVAPVGRRYSEMYKHALEMSCAKPSEG